MRLTKLLVFMLITVIALSFASTKITFWHMYDSGPGKELMDEVIKRFNETNALGIQVEGLAISFWDYWDKLGVAMAAGQEPDIFMHDMGNVASRAYKGILEELTPYFKARGLDADKMFFEVPFSMCKWQGKIYAVPLETDVRLLYYNKDLFKSAGLDPELPPRTWQQLWDYADKLTKKTPQNVYDVIGFNPLYGQSYFWMYVWGTGGTFLVNDQINVNNSSVIKALEEWVTMLKKLGIKEIQNFNAAYGWGADAFLSGKLGMVIQVGQYASTIKVFAPTLNYGVSHIQYPAGRATWSNGFSLEISSRSKFKKEAAEFALYLVSKEVQLLMAQRLNSLVCNKEAAFDPSLMKNEEWKLQVEALQYSQFRPFVLEAPVWYEELQKAVDEVVLTGKDVKRALDDAQKRIEGEILKFKMTTK